MDDFAYTKSIRIKLSFLDRKNKKVAEMSTTYPSWLLSSERVQEVVPIQGHSNICEYRTYQTLTGIASYYLAWTVVCVFHLHIFHITRDPSSWTASWEQVICDIGHANMIYSEKTWLIARRDVLRTFKRIFFVGPRIIHQPRIISATSDVRLHWVHRDSPLAWSSHPSTTTWSWDGEYSIVSLMVCNLVARGSG